MKLEILAFPDKRLRIKAKPVTEITDKIKTLVGAMFETMYNNNGVGLAATQVNHHIRIFVADTSQDGDNPLCFINPEITHKDGEKAHEEGCLSVVGFNAEVKRAKTITIKALDINGKEFELVADDELLAVCIQHEIDHLNGIMFVDYLSKLKQKRLMDKLKKEQR